MKHFIILLFSVVLTPLFGQEFYDLNTIQTIEITFEESNWDALLDAEKAGNGDYIMAQTVSINGVEMDSVGVKYKGNSTYNANQAKNPFHIELDTYKDHDYDGYTDIKLSNVAKDPSFLREVLSYQILNQYMDAPLSNYANVYVNGELIGLYSNSESVSKKFMNSRFYSNDNAFIKCNPVDGAGPGSNDFPNLVYMGDNIADYMDAYELKSDMGWDELVHLCDTLENHIDDLSEILDIDRAIWMLAFNNTLVNLDSYIGAFKQNYYLYRDDYGRFVPVIWDLNESFGRFSMTGSENLNSTIAKQQMDLLLHENDSDFPLIKQILANPMYKRMYVAHCKTIMEENFGNGLYNNWGLTLQALIDDAVTADENKFFSYNDFVSNLNSSVGTGPNATVGITELMDERNTYLINQIEFTFLAPTISDILVSTPTPIVGETLQITAAVSNGSVAFLSSREAFGAPFNRIEMFDDGLHGDGSADDGVFGADLTIGNSWVQYYIYAENNFAGKFSPQRAEHEFYSLTATTSNPEVGDIVINEFMASNDATAIDQNGEYDDWIELYNNTSSTISLDGYHLSDDPEDLNQWPFPAGTGISGDGFLIIWADEDEDQMGLHANFKLSASAETIFLVDPDGNIVDEVSYIDQTTDISYGRFPNGVGNFQIMNPTFNATNSDVTGIEDTSQEANQMLIYPNPAQDYFTIEKEGMGNMELRIYDLNGRTLFQSYIGNRDQINTSGFAPGLYIVQLGNTRQKLVVE